MTTHWEPMLAELSAQRQGRLLAFATMLAGRDMAEDLVQDAVIAVFSRKRQFDSVGHAERYVKRAIASKYVDAVRSQASRRDRERGVAVPEPTPDATAAVDAADAVDRALAALSPRMRACVVLRYLEDLSVRETAHALGLSEGAVKRYTADGLTHMNAALGTDSSPDTRERSDVRSTGGASR